MYKGNNKFIFFYNIWKNCGKKQTVATRIISIKLANFEKNYILLFGFH